MNNTDRRVIVYYLPNRLTFEQFMTQNDTQYLYTKDPGESWTEWWKVQGPGLDERPLCDPGMSWVIASPIDPDLAHDSSDFESVLRFEDLEVIETLVSPCWEDDRVRYSIEG